MSALATATQRDGAAGTLSPNRVDRPRMLSEADKRQFVEDGYLVRRLEFDEALYARAIDLAEQHLDPAPRPNPPHLAPGGGASSAAYHPTPTVARHELARQELVRRRDGVNTIRWLNEVIHGDPRIFEMVRDLIGPDAVPRHAIRRLHPVFPTSTAKPHHRGGMARHPFQVSCILYLSNVERDGGAFMVWPGSHRIMSLAFDGPYAWRCNSQQRELRRKVDARCRPVHLTGPAGTVILWHHRLLHGPDTNRGLASHHALVGDFLRTDWEEHVGETYASGMWAGWAVDDRHLAWHRRLGAVARRLLGDRRAGETRSDLRDR